MYMGLVFVWVTGLYLAMDMDLIMELYATRVFLNIKDEEIN